MYLSQKLTICACLNLVLVAAGCGSDKSATENENEVITTVTLNFTPSTGGSAVMAAVNDADGDGGNPPTIDPVNLSPGMFRLTVKFENKLANPSQDITEEIVNESDQHQIFFTGTAVNGPASNQPNAPLSQAYGDTDANGLPIGLENTITAVKGAGMLTITLRHMPPVNGKAVKTGMLAASVRDQGISAIGGSTDAQVTFPVSVR